MYISRKFDLVFTEWYINNIFHCQSESLIPSLFLFLSLLTETPSEIGAHICTFSSALPNVKRKTARNIRKTL